jgi:hypothetical protein
VWPNRGAGNILDNDRRITEVILSRSGIHHLQAATLLIVVCRLTTIQHENLLLDLYHVELRDLGTHQQPLDRNALCSVSTNSSMPTALRGGRTDELLNDR